MYHVTLINIYDINYTKAYMICIFILMWRKCSEYTEQLLCQNNINFYHEVNMVLWALFTNV